MRTECIQAVSRAMGRQITQAEALKIEQRIKAAQQQLWRTDKQKMSGLSKGDQFTEAAKLAANELKAEAAKKQQRIALTVMAYNKLKADISQNGGVLDSLDRTLAARLDGHDKQLSVESKAKAINAQYAGALSQWIDQFGPKVLGLMDNDKAMVAVFQELRGKDTGIPEAKAFAKELANTFESQRNRFNAAGGKIGKLDDYGHPQAHSHYLVLKAREDNWVAFIEPLLDRSRYVKEDGSLMDDAEFKNFLGHAWKSIAYDGLLKDKAPQQGGGMRANRNSASRQLHFKDADTYMTYHAKFAEKSLMATITGHIDHLSKQIALLEAYGPNPDLMLKTLIKEGQKEAGEVFNLPLSEINHKTDFIERLYNEVAGTHQSIGSEGLKRGFSAARSWLNIRLGSALFSSLSDDASAALTAQVNNLSGAQYMMNELKQLTDADARVQARRLGLGLDTMLMSISRYSQDNLTNGWSQKIGGAVIRAGGLSFVTEARRQGFGVLMMEGIRSLTQKHTLLSDLDSADHRILLSKGVTEADWALWKMAQAEDFNGSQLLTAQSILNIDDAELEAAGLTDKDRQAAADRLMGAILEETGVAIIEPGARERAMTKGRLPQGTWTGELAASMLQFKMFPITLINRHFQRYKGLIESGEKYGAAVYTAALIAGTTFAGAIGVQLNELAHGRDPLAMDNATFLFKSMLKGGALGLYGDFLQSTTTQHGQGVLAALEGPLLSSFEDVAKLSLGNVGEAARGQDPHIGAEAVRFVKGMIPGTSLWYAKAAFDHLIFQNLQEAASPGYLRRMEDRANREFKQKYWWRPGQTAPQRAPDFSTVIGK